MSIDAEKLFALLPAIYRLRDAELGGPLRELVTVIAEQAAIVQEGIEQAYDDQFIETCAEWAVPYLGDLIGARMLQGQGRTTGQFSQRAQVANTLGYRRRKGTLAMLEQLAHDVTNYPAVAVEFFQLLATTQHTNHPRPANLGTVDFRRRDLLERIDTAFDGSAHTLEVRRIASGRGRYNVPNVGLFLFRLRPYQLVAATAWRVDDFRYTFNPLGTDTPLFNLPESEAEITHLAGPLNVPMPISRVAMQPDKDVFYGPDASIFVEIASQRVASTEVAVCNLADKGDGSGDWAHTPEVLAGIDPVLGRLALNSAAVAAKIGKPAPGNGEVRVTFAYGFPDSIGGGSYERAGTLQRPATQVVNSAADLAAALAAVTGDAVIEIADSQTYRLASAAPNLTVTRGNTVELRAANGQRPVILLQGGELRVDAQAGAKELVLSGLLISGGALRVGGPIGAVTLHDCTLVPGQGGVMRGGALVWPRTSLVVGSANVRVVVQRCIMGGLRVANGAQADVEHSIIDATAEDRVAYAASAAGAVAGGALAITNCTMRGRVAAQMLTANNCIFLAAVPAGAPAGTLPLRIEQTQAGCVRFSYVPPGSRVPRCYRCQPGAAGAAPAVRPKFNSLTYGAANYGQLSDLCPIEIRQGAEDESEMGVYHDLYQPQRETNLRVRLDEYLRFGLEAGIIYAS